MFNGQISDFLKFLKCRVIFLANSYIFKKVEIERKFAYNSCLFMLGSYEKKLKNKEETSHVVPSMFKEGLDISVKFSS